MNQYLINDTRTEKQKILFMLAENELEAVTDYLNYLYYEDPTNLDKWLIATLDGKVISARQYDINLGGETVVHDEVWFGVKKVAGR